MSETRLSRFLACALTTAGSIGVAGAASPNPAPLNAITALPVATAGDPTPANPPLISQVVLPRPTNLSVYVKNETVLLRLGKSLFWDMQLGSDGVQACATCHFKAGADSRSKNQVSPGLKRVQQLSNSAIVSAKDTLFGNCLEDSNNSSFTGLLANCAINTSPSVLPTPQNYIGYIGQPNSPGYRTPNYQLRADDFPFYRVADPTQRASASNAVLQDLNDVVSSQGVFSAVLIATTPGQAADAVTYTADADGFLMSGINVRRVEPRNTPTVINSIFNKLQFWDGRGRETFNGIDISGISPSASNTRLMYSSNQNSPTLADAAIDNSSLASLVAGPPLSPFEMSAAGRNFHQLGGKLLARSGKKMRPMRPLANQVVDPADSVLGSLSRSPKPGLDEVTYDGMVQKAFNDEWWKSNYVVQVKSDGSFDKFVKSPSGALADNQYGQAEYNFSLFAGLAIQKYLSTLVSDQTPFDKFQAGDTTALTAQEQIGLKIYVNTAANGGGNCNSCHSIPETTRASVRRAQGVNSSDVGTAPADPLINNNAFGFINNYGVRPAADDPGAEAVTTLAPPYCVTPAANGLPACPSAIANSKFKTPTLRNIGLTAPYFHNGGKATLEQVVEFYARGRGDAGVTAASTLPALIPKTTPLPAAVTVNGVSTSFGLDDGTNKAALVAFLKRGLTDTRVLYEKAPFDHPQIFIPNGHPSATAGSIGPIWSGNTNGARIATDQLFEVKAVGASGTATPLPNFLGLQ